MISDLLNLDLVKELGLENLPKEKREALTNQMASALESRVSIAVLSRISDKEKEELNSLLDDDKDVTAFLREKVPNFDLLVAETVAGFKQEMLELQGIVKKQSATS